MKGIGGTGLRPRVEEPFSPTPIFAYCAVGGLGGPVQSVVALQDGLTRYRFGWLAGAWSDVMRSRLVPTDGELAARVIDVTRPRGLDSIRATVQLARAFRRLPNRDVVVHANGLTELAVLLPVLSMISLPVVVWVHNYELPRKAILLRHAGLLGGRLHVAAVSDFAARVAREALGPDRDVRIIPNPLSDTVIAPRERPGDGRLRIAFLGSDRWNKGFEDLVRTIEGTAGHEFDWKIASNPHPGKRHEWNRLKACEPRGVRLVGKVPEIGEMYGQCDVVFVPSRAESFSRVVAEALANGLFVVASDLQPLREFARLGDTISYFPIGDTDAALERLRDVAQLSPQERHERGARVAPGVRTAFCVSRTAERLEELYDEACSSRHGASGRARPGL